ncbi:fec operon regulator FecR [compost metagenome]|nr:FecR family protein [Pedobacter sp. ok626]
MDDLSKLFSKYINDGCTVAEIKLLMQHFTEVESETELREAITAELEKDTKEAADEAELDNHMLRIYDQLKPNLNARSQQDNILRPIRNYFKYSVAAAIFVVFSVVLYFYINDNRQAKQGDLTAQHQGNDVNPGGNKAILTLADGSKISLTDAGNGELAKQAGIVVTKTKDGQLVYEISKGNAAATEVLYNTINTPAGGQYQINLPDGTTVWLNALSSLRYPTVFNAARRKVVLTGEAYFEVAKNPNQPFVVTTNGAGKAQDVTVLGTHFNINSYQNEDATKTTLLEGSVKVAASAQDVTIKPGQQAILNNTLKVMNVDVTQAIDWKNGNFYFNDENIESIMRKLARWYDIDVIYKGQIPSIDFGGEISRTKKLSEVLKVLETTRTIHFKIEGRRVTVMP